MAEDTFKIFVDRLVDGSTEALSFSVSPELMDVAEEELRFHEPIDVKGQAYVSDQNLFLHLELQTRAQLPCLVCNQMTEVSLSVSGLIHTESVEEIKGKVYDTLPVIREALLLELPLTTECKEGSCPQREEIKHYFSKSQEGEYSPFKDL